MATDRQRYSAVLNWSLRHRWTVVLAGFLTLASTPLIVSRLVFDFLPRDDQSEFEVSITLPEGSNLTRADEVFGEIDKRLRDLRGVEMTYTVVGDTAPVVPVVLPTVEPATRRSWPRRS